MRQTREVAADDIRMSGYMEREKTDGKHILGWHLLWAGGLLGKVEYRIIGRRLFHIPKSGLQAIKYICVYLVVPRKQAILFGNTCPRIKSSTIDILEGNPVVFHLASQKRTIPWPGVDPILSPKPKPDYR